MALPTLAAFCVLMALDPSLAQSTPEDSKDTKSTTATEEQPAQGEAIGTVEAEKPTASEAPLSEAEQWARRLDKYIEAERKGAATRKDADSLFIELTPILRERRDTLRWALGWARSPSDPVDLGADEDSAETAREETTAEVTETTEELTGEASSEPDTVKGIYTTVSSLYDTRIRLLKYVTPQLRARVTGAGLAGVRELRGEIEQLSLHVRFQMLSIPREVAELPGNLNRAPLPIVGRTLEFILAVMIFIGWRRWAKAGLADQRRKLLDARPRRRRNLRIAKILWYLDRVRSPLEWLILLAVFFGVVNLPIQDELEKAPWIALRWILLTWFAIALISAMAARGFAGLSGETAKLRFVSLQIVAAWLVFLGLGLDLAEQYAGRGTIYAWFWMLFKVFTLPVLVVLVALWRTEIFRQIENEPQCPAWIRNTLQHKTGWRSFFGAVLASPYLIFVRMQQQLLRGVSELEWGRRLQASYYKRELGREQARLDALGGKQISPELRDKLVMGRGQIIDKIARADFVRLVELVEEGRGGVAAIIAERGCGKSMMLRRLAAKFEKESMVIDCPPTGYDAVATEFSRALGLGDGVASVGEIGRAVRETGVRVIGLDNMQRMFRPIKGGQTEMERLSALFREIGGRVFWVLTVDKLTWHYTNRMRADQAITPSVFELPLWTEERLSDLVDQRCREAGITPDFAQLILPRYDDDVGQDTLTGRNRLAFFRFLWDAADGNPAVALRLWAESLAVTEDGRYVVHLPSPSVTSEIEKLSPVQLLVLRVIAQSELISPEEIALSLRYPDASVGNALLGALQQGWIEEFDGRYRLTWDWYRTITRVLVRKNFLNR